MLFNFLGHLKRTLELFISVFFFNQSIFINSNLNIQKQFYAPTESRARKAGRSTNA